jgi:hypothetical protein
VNNFLGTHNQQQQQQQQQPQPGYCKTNRVSFMVGAHL